MGRTFLLLLAGMLVISGCGDDDDDDTSADGDADADADADADGDADADADGDADADADGDCGGTDTLEVLVTVPNDEPLSDPVPAEGAEIALDCGATRVEATTDAEGRAVFQGLDLAGQPVDLTAFRDDTDTMSRLGVDSNEEPVSMPLLYVGGSFAGYTMYSGDVTYSDPDAQMLLSATGSGYILVATDSYQFYSPTSLDQVRVTALEYRVEDDGNASALSIFDQSVAFPTADGPDIVFSGDINPIRFTAMTVIDADAAYSDRPLPDDDPQNPTRLGLYAAVFDLNDEGIGPMVGFTTSVTPGDGQDDLVISRIDALQGNPLTRVTLASGDHLALTTLQVRSAPEEVVNPEIGAPPSLEGVEIDGDVDLAGEVTVNVPDWAATVFVAVVKDQGISQLFGGLEPWWRVVARRDQPVRFPLPPGGRARSDVLPGGTLRVRAGASSLGQDVDPLTQERITFGLDARYFALVSD